MTSRVKYKVAPATRTLKQVYFQSFKKVIFTKCYCISNSVLDNMEKQGFKKHSIIPREVNVCKSSRWFTSSTSYFCIYYSWLFTW